MNCRSGAGSYKEIDDGFIYETGSGFGYYEFVYNVGIYFEGRRNSFKDGTEFWNNAGIAESCNGNWELVESNEPERDVWS